MRLFKMGSQKRHFSEIPSVVQVDQHEAIYYVERRPINYSDFVQLISERRFMALNDVIQQINLESFKSEYANWILPQFMKFQNQLSILHYVCMFQPPLSTVKILAQIDEEALSVPDTNGWCPLHVACQYFASSEVIQYLVNKYPASLKLVDNDSRTALHLVMDNPIVNPKVVKILVTKNPSIVEKEDRFGNTAMELALVEGKVGMRCINLVNEAVKKERERNIPSLYPLIQ